LKPISASSPPKTENCKPTFVTILEISQLRPDRIIFEGKEVKLTPLAFSLLYLLAQNPKEVLIYDYLINTIWKGSRDATYTQITFHLSKIRRAILKTICYNKKNRKKVKEIFKVVSRRGIMLNLEEDKLKIN
jgi:helicase